jgi:hypothetical protein
MVLEFCTIEALNLRSGSKELEAFNVERVRGYLERNLGCKKKEVIHALGLHPRTVAKAIKIIRARTRTSGCSALHPSSCKGLQEVEAQAGYLGRRLRSMQCVRE